MSYNRGADVNEKAQVMRIAVLTCMDSSIEEILRSEYENIHLIRNAGGRATEDAIFSLSVSYELFGIKEIIIVNHTQCTLQGYSQVL